MNLTYSRQNIQFLKLAFNYAAWFAVLPMFDFDKQVMVKPKLFKIYSLFLLFIVISGFSWHQYYVWKDILDNGLYFTVLLMTFSQFVMLLLCVICIAGSAFWSMNKWEKMLQSFLALEEHLNQETKYEASFLKNFYFQFIVTNIVVIAVLINSFLSWSLYIPYKVPPWIYILEGLDLLNIYVKCLKVHIGYNIILAIKCKYQDLNSFLIRGCSYWNWQVPKTVRIVSHLYGQLGKTVNTFSALYGWQFILSLFHSTATELICFNLARGFTIPGSGIPLLHLILNAICLFIISVVRQLLFIPNLVLNQSAK